jgi:hypothetical protein
MKGRERLQVEELFFVHLNMLNAGTKGVNAAISSRKHISATADGGDVRGVKMDASVMFFKAREVPICSLYTTKLWRG